MSLNIGIVCYPTFGGSGVVATELGKALAQKGHNIHFITYQLPVKLDVFSKNIFYHEVAVGDYPLFDYQPYELILSSRMVEVALFEKLDLLHVHYAIPHASAAFMAREILKTKGRKVPYITTLHGTDITLLGRDTSYEPVITFAINQSNAVTAVSESLKKDSFAYFPIEQEIEVIPNFVCLEQYNGKNIPDENLRKSIAPNGEKIITHISNFRKVKRVEDVLHIFEQVEKHIPARLLLVGDGPERSRLESICREKKLCNRITFAGKMKDTEKVLRISDLFLLPSETESFGLSALEAMAAGVPVISTNSGGLPEVNIHGFSGYTSDVGNTEEMAKSAIHLLADKAIWKTFSNQAKAQARKFDIHQILPRYEELYLRVLAQ